MHYDANGNPTAVDNKYSSLSYDNLNHLRQIAYAKTDEYWYDRTGVRIKRTEDVAGTWRTTYTMFEGDNPLIQEVYDNSGRIQVLFNLIADGRILAQYKRVYPSTDSVVYFYLDNLNSRRAVLSSTPAVIDRYRYSAWGVPTQDAGSDHYESFTGKDYDATGLIYFNARYYDPITGRFLTEDPSRQGVNWYAYCQNNPVNRIDPTGMREILDDGPRGPVYAPRTSPSRPERPSGPSLSRTTLPPSPGELLAKLGTYGNPYSREGPAISAAGSEPRYATHVFEDVALTLTSASEMASRGELGYGIIPVGGALATGAAFQGTIGLTTYRASGSADITSFAVSTMQPTGKVVTATGWRTYSMQPISESEARGVLLQNPALMERAIAGSAPGPLERAKEILFGALFGF